MPYAKMDVGGVSVQRSDWNGHSYDFRSFCDLRSILNCTMLYFLHLKWNM